MECVESRTSPTDIPVNLREVVVRPIRCFEEPRYQGLMQQHHYLGSLPKIGETLWYVATWREEWAALLSFSAAALKCAARDRWIGWDFRHQYSRLKLVVKNSRFLIVPCCHGPNLRPPYQIGGSTIMLAAAQMQSLPSFFSAIPDPRRAQGRRHRLPTVLAVAAGAVLCGMRGYRAISDWAKSLGQKSRQRFGCR